MSAPIRNDDEIDDEIDDPRSYAPHWARQSPPVVPELFMPATAPRVANAPSAAPRIPNAPPMVPGSNIAPPMARGIGSPNIDPPPLRLRRFEGDVAIKDLRDRMSLDPDLVLQPPIRLRNRSVVPWIGRLAFVLFTAATVAFAVTLMTLPNEVRRDAGGIVGLVTPLLENLSQPGTPAQPPRLVVESQRAFANDPLPLGVSLNAASGGETLTLVGLATGTKLSAGTPLGSSGWQVSARDLGKAFAYAPKDFVGVMDTAIDLRSARDRLVDSQMVRLEWVQKKEARLAPPAPRLDQPKPPPIVAVLDPEEVATLIKRGEEFLKNGDIASARLFLRRAANAGHAQAALTLGVTFDPTFLAEHGVLGFAPDVTQAAAWYERAIELGSTEAARRLERLTGMGSR